MSELIQRLANTAELTDTVAPAADIAWKLELPRRDLDSNLVRLAADSRIDQHIGGEVDVLMHVLAGSGIIGTDSTELPVTPGDLLWLPRGTGRSITAGPNGLDYLTVHTHRRPELTIGRFDPDQPFGADQPLDPNQPR